MDRRKLMNDQNPQYHFKIEKAYAKNYAAKLNPTNERWDGGSDIGVLVSERLLFDQEELRTALSSDKPLIVPACLATSKAVFVGEKIKGVGWGLTYKASDYHPDGYPYVTTCMTNEVGPERWRFHNCNMKKIKENNWSCEKVKRPPSNDADQLKCRSWIDKAKDMIGLSEIEFMDKVEKIYIYSFNNPDSLLHVCYNEKLFAQKGWCFVNNKGPDIDPESWGFCSPSCDKSLMDASGLRLGNVYKEIDWTVDTAPVNPDHPCYYNHYSDDYDVCMKNILPQAKFARVETIGARVKKVSFDKDDESKVTSYKAICDADSGSGNWVTFKDDSSSDSSTIESRSVLVAVISKSIDEIFENDDEGFDGVCGANIILESGKLLTAGSTAVKITNPVISDFIKNYAEIIK